MDMAVNCTKLRCSKNKDCDPCLNVISTKIIEILLLAAAVSIATSIFNWIGIFGGYKFKQALNEYWEDQISISGEESDSEYYYE
uniref:Uncharacterized protein n=1 Tax=Rhabditophanes sp. KR3021 TaxID=114890 RepID=A0AC35U391_9BILA